MQIPEKQVEFAKTLKILHKYPSFTGGYQSHRGVAELSVFDDAVEYNLRTKKVEYTEGDGSAISIEDLGDKYQIILDNGKAFVVEYTDMELITAALYILEQDTFPERKRKVKVLSSVTNKVLSK